jgi:hypothetical protein
MINSFQFCFNFDFNFNLRRYSVVPLFYVFRAGEKLNEWSGAKPEARRCRLTLSNLC